MMNITKIEQTKVFKYTIISIFLSIVLSSVVFSANTTASALSTSGSSVDGALSVSNVAISPTPVIAGSNVTLSFSLFNSYSQELTNVNIGLESSSELINVSPSKSYLVDSIGTGIYGGIGSNPFIYKLHIPSTLISGIYTIDVVANYETTTSGSSVNLPGSSVIPITVYIYGKPNLNFNVQEQSNIIPGSALNANLIATNTGTATARNITVTIKNTNDFSVIGQNEYTFGDTAPGATQQIPLDLLVNSNITSGTHNITLYVSYTGSVSNFTGTVNVPVDVALGVPHIVTSIVNAQPEQIYSGGNQTLTINIQNTGSGIARDLVATFLSSNTISVSGSASTFYIGMLQPGSSINENLYITANGNSSETSSFIPVELNYTSANYANATSIERNISINIAKSAVFQITNVTDNSYPGNAYGPIVLKIKNTGNEAATQISISLQSIYPLSPVAGNAYIAQLNPGESTNVTFYISTDQNGNPGQYPITIYEQWKQNNGAPNQVFYGSNNYYATVYANAGQSSGTNSNGGGINYILYAVIIVIVAVFVYRYREKIIKRQQKGTHSKK
ncbi:MAG: hypothetical protein M1385_00145 [Candidatus Marsarchaeota archaeon]|nr:hypothetical protein [Candidatus Marsarchaeota archaeon]